jgi:hypothetical protein
VPGISPRPVANEESLLREVLNPDHVVNGEVQSSAIPLKELQERGFSVHRLEYVTREFVENAISQKLARTFQGSARVSEGVARLTARVVREIRDNGNQTFVVVDTATRSNPGHASIYLSNAGMKGSLARRMRDRLLPLLENRTSVAEAFAGQ